MRSFAAAAAALSLALPLAAQNSAGPAPVDRNPHKYLHLVGLKPAAHERHLAHAAAPTNRHVHRSATTPTPTPAPARNVPASVQPASYAQNPINQLRGNARALLVFAPDSALPAMQQQMLLLDRHELELTKRNTVFVPIVTHHTANTEEIFAGENLNPGSYRDQLSARLKFGLKYNDFAVILLDKNGNEQFRSTSPVNVGDLAAQLDSDPISTTPQETALASLRR